MQVAQIIPTIVSKKLQEKKFFFQINVVFLRGVIKESDVKL